MKQKGFIEIAVVGLIGLLLLGGIFGYSYIQKNKLLGARTIVRVPQGGTGWETIVSGSFLLGNGTGNLSTTTAISVSGNDLHITGDIFTYGGDINLGTGSATTTLTVNAANVLQITNGGFIAQASSTVVGNFTITGTCTGCGAISLAQGNFLVGNPSGIGAATSSIFVSSAQRIGIGTTTPNWKLQVAGTRPFLTLSDTSAGADLKHWFLSSQGGNLYVGTTTDGYATSSISALSLFGGMSGVLSIGTTTDKLAGRPSVTATGTVITASQIAPMGFPIPFGNVFATTTYATSTAHAQNQGGSFTIPAGVYRIYVEAYGGGGGGGGEHSTDDTGGGTGGGAGGVSEGFLDVIPGQVLSLTIGRGGGGGASGSSGFWGGTTTVSTLIAGGGGLGQQNNASAVDSGGVGGIASGGTINSQGGGGGLSPKTSTSVTRSGSTGGSNKRGGGGRAPGGGLSGTAPFGGIYGGGGAGANADANNAGGAGGGGGVIIWW